MSPRPQAASGSTPPPRPADDSALGFSRKNPVRWFSPKVLASTGQRVILSSAMGDFLDKRELQRSVIPYPIDHGDPRDDVWIDYVADTGDGFNSTYSIAWLTAQRQLAVEGLNRELPRPGLLVFGGDEVYPAAAPEEYDNRFRGPYMASLPFMGTENPKLLAIPGNHDWYDGLTNFMRLFCPTDGTWIGGRKTCQTHSYFAVRLPNNWWLWGIDIQFDAFIDDPQIQFFEGLAKTMDQRGRIILCTGKPSWTDVQADPAAFRNLGHFHKRVIAPYNADLLLSISGDSHHYARYEAADGTQRITAGGGGAFLHPTHHLDDPLKIPVDPRGDRVQRYKLRCRYPSPRRSRLLSGAALQLPLRSRTFMLVPAIAYLILGWSTQFAVRVLDSRLSGPLDEAAPRIGRGDLLAGLFRNPVSILVLAIVLGGLLGFAKPSRNWSHGPKKVVAKLLMGSAHFVLHVAVGVLVVGPLAIWSVSWSDGFVFYALILIVLSLLGGLVGSLTMGAYLAVCCAFFRAHGNEAFSAQANTGYKNFLRLHIDPDGVLTVYPVGLDQATTKWRYDPANTDEDAPWLAPFLGADPRPRLIEQPIVIDPRVRT